MRQVVRQLAGALGYEIHRKGHWPESNSGPSDFFHSYDYLQHNARRLEHLASLRLPVTGMTVLEVGAGIGDHTGYFIDRGCDVTATDARDENLRVLRERYPGRRILRLDLEHPQSVEGAPFDVVHCYGLLYHLNNPAAALKFMAEHCKRMLLLETCVSFGDEKLVNLVGENAEDPTQAFSGTGCRPTRPWLFDQLKIHFPFVYCPTTQPNHEEFPIDWRNPDKHSSKHGLQRSVLIASRAPIENDQLSVLLLVCQTRQL
jgi:hypothetical protein